MWLKWLCLLMIVNVSLGAESFLSHLYGLSGRNRMLVCLRPSASRRARECTGALVHEQLVGVRAGCLRQHPSQDMVVVRLTRGESCDGISGEYDSPRFRGVLDLYFHPWADLALIRLSRPYYDLDIHPNSTRWTVTRAFKPYGTSRWVRDYMIASSRERDLKLHYMSLHHGMMSTRSPLLMFLLSIFLPLVLLVLVFFYIIYYTGTSEDVPYKNLQYTY